MAGVKGDIKVDRLLLLAAVVFVLLFLCGHYAITRYEDHYSDLYRNATEKNLLGKASSLEKAIDNQFALLYGLRSFVHSRFDCFSAAQGCQNRASVMSFLANIYASTNSVHSISIAPGGVHRFVYPENSVTKLAIGHDLLNDSRPHVVQKVHQTIETRQLGVSGPYSLRQDGTLVLVARLPVYDNDAFWGFVIMVIDLPKMLNNLEINQHGDVSLSSNQSGVFWNDLAVFKNNSLAVPVHLPDGQWEMATLSKDVGVPVITRSFLYFFLLFGTFLLSYFFLLALKTQRRIFRESESRYLSLFQENHSIILLIDPETGDVVDANPSACEFYGYSKHQLLAKNITEINQLSKENIYGAMNNVMSGKKRSYIFQHRLADGSIRDVEVFAGSIFVEQQELLYSVIYDVSDRLYAERKLSESERKFRLLADHTYDWEFWLDVDGVCLYSSPSCERITGYSPQEFIEDPGLIFRIIVDSYKNEVINHYSAARDEYCCAEVIDFPIFTKTGERAWLEHRCFPLFDDEGVFRGRRGTHRDITERKQMEREQGELLRAIDQSDEMFITTGIDGAIQYVNPAFEKVTGFSRHEVLGKNPRFLQSGDQPESFYVEMWSVLLRGETWKGTFVNRKKDGSVYVEAATISPVRDKHGEITSFVAVKRDTTKEIEAEAKRRELEEQLHQKTKIEAIGLLAGGLAHNFNNCLAIILGYVELLRQKNQNDETNLNYINNARTGIDRARELIRQIMTFSRASDGGEVEPCNVQAIINETLNFLDSTLPGTVVIVHKANEIDDPVHILIGTTRLQQILLNLCNNAVHAMNEKGTITVFMATVTLDKEDIPLFYDACVPGTFVRISVTDTGSGISKANLARIFDPFYTTKGIDVGTGLGLATTQGVVKDAGGMIAVDTQLGQGTTFNIFIPIISSTGNDNCAIETDVPGGDQTILLVDDEPLLVEVGKNILSTAGYQVYGVTDCVEALSLLRSDAKAIDLVLTDWMMPKLDGYEFIRELRKIRPEIPIVVCTGFRSQDLMTKMETLNVDGLIEKPFNPTELLKNIAKVLDNND